MKIFSTKLNMSFSSEGKDNIKKKQEVLGRTNRLLSFRMEQSALENEKNMELHRHTDIQTARRSHKPLKGIFVEGKGRSTDRVKDR
jgi:hypothetical protein